MGCSACAERVRAALSEVPKVVSAKVDLTRGMATVDHDNADIVDLGKAVEKAGYSTDLL